MKFGIFYEISVPRPWDGEAEKRVFDNCLEQVAPGKWFRETGTYCPGRSDQLLIHIAGEEDDRKKKYN